MNDSSLTERGQVSVPASLRRAMGLKVGQRLHWEQVSESEILVSLREETPTGPLSVLGYAQRVLKMPERRTEAWMQELREGE
ncbi:MAG: AbrB/MazE/SpoVT family DNA-binding domain-containing protein [Verrucomicrobiaceae bacterium]|nr:AbrB/MazE/SpoVT family DNA-binding domain-containing protein [Verrucomicrobiaceae bacterium]